MNTASSLPSEGQQEHPHKRRNSSSSEPNTGSKRSRISSWPPISRLLDPGVNRVNTARSNDSGIGSEISNETAGNVDELIEGGRASSESDAEIEVARVTVPELEDHNGGEEEDDDDGRRFACPFFKHDPQFYNPGGGGVQFRACSGPGWRSFKDIKDHIFRRHKAPPYCERCFSEFPTESQRLEHLRRIEPCVRREPRQIHGVTPEHRDRIKSEPRKCKTEAERWTKVYQIIFGKDDPVPSPYYEHIHYMTEQIELFSTTLEFLDGDMEDVVATSLEEVFGKRKHIAVQSPGSLALETVSCERLREVLTERLRDRLSVFFRNALRNSKIT